MPSFIFHMLFSHGVNWLVSQTVSFHFGIVIKPRNKRENVGGGQSQDSLILESWGTRENQVSLGDEGSDGHSGILEPAAQTQGSQVAWNSVSPSPHCFSQLASTPSLKHILIMKN